MAEAATAPAVKPQPYWRRAIRFVADRRVTTIVIVVLLAMTAVCTIAVRSVIRDQEKRLLAERTNEIVALLGTASASTRELLSGLGTAATAGGAQSPQFTLAASQEIAQGTSVGVAQLRNGAYSVIASKGPAAAGAVPGPPADLANKALQSKDFVSVRTTDSSGVHLIVALKIAAAVPTVAYLISPLQPNRPAPTTSDSPYRELDAAVFASTRADPAQLLLVSGSYPASTRLRASKPFAFGADTWLVVAAARQPLVGTFAATFPWTVLIGGMLAVLLVAAMMDVLSRRRVYAMRLVEEHTRTLREAQEAAEAANRAKSEFISRMSHELRTPLNAVLGFGQILELYADLTQDQHDAVKHITNGGRHLLDLINEILDISQVESGRLALSPEAVRVGDVVQETTELLQPIAAERAIQLIDPEAPLCRKYVFADHQRLKQVMLNVIGNGIKYNRQGGSVTIRCEEHTPGRLRILVTDTGPGIGPSQIPLLFTPFERLGAERTTIEGTGMGLALSKHLVEAMGGTLGVDSVVGSGSTFSIELPMVEGPVDRYHRLADADKRREELARRTILHIEDNLSNVKLVEQILTKRPGIELLAAMQGSIGLELAREHRPMLILLDLNLPDVPGEQVLAALLEDPRTARIPVVIVSADATQRQVQRLLSSGASAYLTKPIDVRELLKLIDAAATTRVAVSASASAT